MKKILLTLLCVFIISICSSSAFAASDTVDNVINDSIQTFDENDISTDIDVNHDIDVNGIDPTIFQNAPYDPVEVGANPNFIDDYNPYKPVEVGANYNIDDI